MENEIQNFSFIPSPQFSDQSNRGLGQTRMKISGNNGSETGVKQPLKWNLGLYDIIPKS